METPSPNYPAVLGLVVFANVLWFWGIYLLRRRGIKRAWFFGDLTHLWKLSLTEQDQGSRIGMRAIVVGIVASIIGVIALL